MQQRLESAGEGTAVDRVEDPGESFWFFRGKAQPRDHPATLAEGIGEHLPPIVGPTPQFADVVIVIGNPEEGDGGHPGSGEPRGQTGGAERLPQHYRRPASESGLLAAEDDPGGRVLERLDRLARSVRQR